MKMQRKGRHFQAGQAPACWQQQIRRTAGRVRALATACTWLEKGAISRPRLRSQPLLGRCLEIVANQETPLESEIETSPPTPTPGRSAVAGRAAQAVSTPDSLSDRPARRRQNRSMATGNQRQHRPDLPAQKRANRALLHRLTGQPITPPKHHPPVADPPSLSSPQAPPAGVSAPMQTNDNGGAPWSQRVAGRLYDKRAERAALQIAAPNQAASASAAAMKVQRLAQQLAQQWSQPLDGPRASSAQLAYWAQRQRPIGAAQVGQKRAATSGPLGMEAPTGSRAPVDESAQTPFAGRQTVTPTSAMPSNSSPAAGGGHDGTTPHRPRINAAAASAASTMPGRQENFNAHFNGPQSAANGQHDSAATLAPATDNAPLIAPPQLAPKLPKLTAPNPPDHAPTAIAAATAHQGALANLLGDDELNGLAASIKRILDTEARRHGIDV